jgi:putative transposase
MANTYSQIFIHLIFAVKNRQSLIRNEWKDRLYQYIAGIIKSQKQKLYIINGMPDHLHILVSIQPDIRVSDLVRDVKTATSKWINENKLSRYKFNWQEGFGSFSCSKSSLESVISYIKNQEEHHKKTTFREEYIKFLEKYGVDYKPEYIFEKSSVPQGQG